MPARTSSLISPALEQLADFPGSHLPRVIGERFEALCLGALVPVLRVVTHHEVRDQAYP